MKKPSKKLIALAQAEANKLRKEVAIGLPIFADQRSEQQLYVPIRGARITKAMMRGDTGYNISYVAEPEVT